jgi:hypothetical protein
MIADLDIYRAAKLAIDQYGADASIQAAMRADALLDEGDIEGSAVSLLDHLAGRPEGRGRSILGGDGDRAAGTCKILIS